MRRNRNRNLKISKALLKRQAHQVTSLFTSAEIQCKDEECEENQKEQDEEEEEEKEEDNEEEREEWKEDWKELERKELQSMSSRE